MDGRPRCGKPGYLYGQFVTCRRQNRGCASGRLHGPYLKFGHYAGYIREGDRRRLRACYIGARRLSEHEEERIEELRRYGCV
ncbi:MAG: hypothetical protein QW172_05085 [Candidatus Bathyarchaeia archaeon]